MLTRGKMPYTARPKAAATPLADPAGETRLPTMPSLPSRRSGGNGWAFNALRNFESLWARRMEIDRAERGKGGPAPQPDPSPERVQRAAQTYGLSKAEGAVLLLLQQGHSNAEIARRLFVSPETVRSHMKRIFAKLGVHSRTRAVLKVSGTEG
jgi:DNA-binding CsgD family transcriptional regulator